MGLAGLNNFPAQLSASSSGFHRQGPVQEPGPAVVRRDHRGFDSKTGLQVLKLLCDVRQRYGSTVALITHNEAIAPLADRVIRVRSGRMESVETNPRPATVEEIAW